MQLTAKYKLPYPDGIESVSPDRDLKALAEAVEAIMTVGLPTGAIMPFNGTTLPAGWAWCDGSAHGSPTLQSVIGSPNSPDLRGRFLLGSGTTAHGTAGGADTVTVAIAQLGPHTHPGTASGAASADHTHGGQPPDVGAAAASHDHQHAAGGPGGDPADGWMAGDGGTIKTNTAPSYGGILTFLGNTEAAGGHAHGVNATTAGVNASGDPHTHAPVGTTPAGGGGARPNVPAHVSLNHIIKL